MIERKSEFCLCGCGQRLKGKQKMFASLACNKRYHKDLDLKRESEFCLCGCGQRLKGKQTRFATNACLKRYNRYLSLKTRPTFCFCGCGKPLTKKKRKFASEACKRRWRVNNLVYPDRYKRKIDLITALKLADLVFEFELETSKSETWSIEVKQAKEILGKFCKELKDCPGLAILVKADNSRT